MINICGRLTSENGIAKSLVTLKLHCNFFMISPASGVFFLAFPSGPDLPSPSCLCAIVFHFMFLPSATKLRQGNVFTPVCHSVHKGGSASVHAGIDPLGRHPPGQTPPQADTPLGRPPGQITPPQQTATAAHGTHPTGMHSCYP